jgi:hypothetical protein
MWVARWKDDVHANTPKDEKFRRGTFAPARGSPSSALKKDLPMRDEPRTAEPKITPPVPEVPPPGDLPEIPADKDAPAKKIPTRGEV